MRSVGASPGLGWRCIEITDRRGRSPDRLVELAVNGDGLGRERDDGGPGGARLGGGLLLGADIGGAADPSGQESRREYRTDAPSMILLTHGHTTVIFEPDHRCYGIQRAIAQPGAQTSGRPRSKRMDDDESRPAVSQRPYDEAHQKDRFIGTTGPPHRLQRRGRALPGPIRTLGLDDAARAESVDLEGTGNLALM